MEPISLALAKQHLQIDPDYTANDVYLETIIKAARLLCEKFCNAKYDELAAPVDSGTVDAEGNPVMITPEMEDFNQAILMTIADLYDNRGTVVIGTITSSISLTARVFLKPYKRFIWA